MIGNSEQWARSEASRCLYCYEAQCIKGCPANIDIPRFIQLIRWGDIKGAKKIIKEANSLGGLCAYLCPAEELCEKNCACGKYSQSIRISDLQKYACDHGSYDFTVKSENGTGKKVAVIGAGPAGISCAVQLKSEGYEVTIFEKEKDIGGIVTKEIPRYKIPQQVIEKELAEIKKFNVRIEYKKYIDDEFLTGSVLPEYDAVFISIGLNADRDGGITKLVNVYYASEFLSLALTGKLANMRGACVTIGGGDTAVDCARTALRLGASRSIIAYRRSPGEMKAAEYNYLSSVKEGVEYHFMVAPEKIRGTEKAEALEFCRTELTGAGQDGRKSFEKVAGYPLILPVDYLVLAFGKERSANLGSLLAGPKTNINEETLQLADSKVFAGGDFVNRGKTVVEAVAHGKKAADSIIKYLEKAIR